jgi:hypothetical protein
VTRQDIARWRLANQQISYSRFSEPHEVVAALGAMQAQDYSASLWAIGLRLRQATEAAVELAIAERKIVRTWPMRGTLHFVSPADVRWMLALLSAGIIAKAAGRFRQLELDESIFARCRKLFVKALEGDRQLTREALMSLLERENIAPTGQRGYHILWRLAQEGLICISARERKQQTFALLDDWSPSSYRLDPEAALAELALRYFRGHGPATLKDFVWWAGLKVSDAKRALESVSSQLEQQTMDGTAYWMAPGLNGSAAATPSAYLLPGFDEYLLGYANRSAVLDPLHAGKIVPGGNGIFQLAVVMNGRVVGTWKRVLKKNHVLITASPFKPFTRKEQIAFDSAADHYSRFVGLPNVR